MPAVAAQAVGAACLTVVAVTGAPWSVAVLGFWFPVYLLVLYRIGLRHVTTARGAFRSTAAVAPALGLPMLGAFTALGFTQRILGPLHFAAALAVMAMGVFGGWFGVVGLLRLRAMKQRASTAPAQRGAVVAAWGAVVLFAVPFVAGAVTQQVLEDRIARCDEMAPQVPGARRSMLGILAEACAQRDGEAALFHAGGVRVEVYPGRRNADVAAVAKDAVSIVNHLGGVLGDPPFDRITIHPVAITGSVRGMAGPGYLLIDSAELIAPQGCGQFRSSAGTEGTCGSWVLAHELAHEWFPGRAALGERGDQVAWEGTADYLAWDWWRRSFGEEDAAALREELFHGRMLLAPEFAASNAPGMPPGNLTDSQGRALIYGRGPLGWIAAENRAGIESVRAVLRRSLPASEQVLTVHTILEAAEPAPEVRAVLDSWWLDPAFEPEIP